MGYLALITDWVQNRLACQHRRVCVAEGKNYCPDCGQGVVYRWVVLKCTGCGVRRPSRYGWQDIEPTEACCKDCGERTVEMQTIDEPSIYQLSHALMQVEVVSGQAQQAQGSNILNDLIGARRAQYARPAPPAPSAFVQRLRKR